MRWEVRHGGRCYLHRNRPVMGKQVKEYVAGCSVVRVSNWL